MESTHFAAGNITTAIVRNFTEKNTSFVAQYTSSSDISIPSPLWFSYVILALSCLLVSLGLFGNFTTLVVLQKSKTLSTGSRLTLMALAVSDTGSLITWTIYHSILPQVFKIDIVALTVTGCRLFMAVFRISSTCSALFVVLICIERFTVVWFPLKSNVLLTKAAAIASISFVVGIAVMLAVPVFIFTKIINGVCTPQQIFETLLLQIPEYISIATYSIIPALVLICLTPLIIVKLYKQQSIRRRKPVQKRNKIPRHTIMLVGVVISYISLITVAATLFKVLSYSGFNMFSNELWVIMFRTILILMSQINYSTNFLLYSAFSGDFRRQLRQMVNCKNPVDYATKE